MLKIIILLSLLSMNWLFLFFLNFYFEKEFVAGAEDFYNYFSLDFSLKRDYFKDGIPFLIPFKNEFELLFNSAHKISLLFKGYKITYPDSQIILSLYTERDKYKSSLNGFLFQRPVFKKFMNARIFYDIYTSEPGYPKICQHHYFFQIQRKNNFDFLYYHSDFDFPNYYNFTQKEKYEIYNMNYYFKNIKFSFDYQYLGNFLNHTSISQLKSEITLTMNYKSFISNIILKDKILRYFKAEGRNRVGFCINSNFKNLIYVDINYENDKKFHNEFSFEAGLNLFFKNFVFLPFYLTGLYFPNPLFESSIFPLYSVSKLKRTRKNVFGFYIFSKNLEDFVFSYEYGILKDIYVFKNGKYELLDLSSNFLQGNIFKKFNNLFLKFSTIYAQIPDFYPCLNFKTSSGLEKKIKEDVKILFEYSLFFTEKRNMSSSELKINFSDVLFTTFRINNVFSQKFYLYPNFNFDTTHLTILISANIWH
jgi:hypothetical protein